MTELPELISAKSVSVRLGGRSALDRVSLSVASGEVVVLVGPNGAGKSTLLRVLAGEVTPDSGSAALEGEDMRHISPSRLAARRAVVPQSSMLSFPFTVAEVVMLGVAVPGFAMNDQGTQHADRALAAVGLQAFGERKYTGLSGGERQRVHIARALCQLDAGAGSDLRPPVLLLDEPTASLDLAHQFVVLTEAQRRSRRGTGVLVVLHDLNLAACFADRIAVMRDGRILDIGPPMHVLRNDLLSAAFSVAIHVGHTKRNGLPYVLPQEMSNCI